MTAKRRLPVLDEPPSPTRGRGRGASAAWVAALSLLGWLPLAGGALALARLVLAGAADGAPMAASPPRALLAVGLLTASFALAHALGGYFGRRIAAGDARAAAAGGALSATVCWVLGLGGGALPTLGAAVSALLVLLTIATVSAAAGAGVGAAHAWRAAARRRRVDRLRDEH